MFYYWTTRKLNTIVTQYLNLTNVIPHLSYMAFTTPTGHAKIWNMVYAGLIIHQTFSLASDWSEHIVHVTKCSPAKTGKYPRIFSNFQN